jgi:hypothetical protein
MRGGHRGAVGGQIGLASQLEVECFELSCSLQEEQRSVFAIVEDQGEVAAEQSGSRGLKPVQRVRVHHGQKTMRLVEPSGLEAQLRGTERALRSPYVGCQPEGALQERGRRGGPSAGARAVGASVQLPSDLLVGSQGRRSQMPGPTVWVGLPVGRLCQGEMHAPALIRGRRSIDRGANQRMPEPHRLLDLEQPIHAVNCRDIDPEPLGCTPDDHRALRVSSGGVWKTPRPTDGISTPLFRMMFETLCLTSLLLILLAVDPVELAPRVWSCPSAPAPTPGTGQSSCASEEETTR